MAITRKDIRQRLGSVEFCGDMIASSASGNGSTTTLVDTSLKQADDLFIDAQIVPLSGNGANAPRYVTDWVQSTSTFTVDRAWSGATATSDTYELHRLFSYSDKNNAINSAIRAAGTRWVRNVIDSVVITLDASTYRYDLDDLTDPDPILSIDRIEYQDGSSDEPFVEIPPSYWRIEQDDVNGKFFLQFNADTPIKDNADTRIYHRVRPSVLSSDSSTLSPFDDSFYNYICAKAAAMLFRARAQVQPDNGWEERANMMEEMAGLFYAQDRPLPKPGRMRFPTWGRDYSDPDQLPINFGL